MRVLEPETHAVLLLTTEVGEDGARDIKPLSRAEWQRLSRWLETRCRSSAQLLHEDSSAVLDGFEDRTVSVERVRALMSRGGPLGFALERWRRAGVWVVSIFDQDYPERLRAVAERAPPVLFGCGDRALMAKSAVAIVGSRDASPVALEEARRLGAWVASQQCVVVSGAAQGVDLAAMKGCLSAGGAAVGVLADELLRRALEASASRWIRAGGLALVSAQSPESRLGHRERLGKLDERNAFVHGWAEVSIVVSISNSTNGTWNGAVEKLVRRWGQVWLSRVGGQEGKLGELASKGAKWLPDSPLLMEDLTAVRRGLDTHYPPAPSGDSSVAETIPDRLGSWKRAFGCEPKRAKAIFELLGISKDPDRLRWLKSLLQARTIEATGKGAQKCYCLLVDSPMLPPIANHEAVPDLFSQSEAGEE